MMPDNPVPSGHLNATRVAAWHAPPDAPEGGDGASSEGGGAAPPGSAEATCRRKGVVGRWAGGPSLHKNEGAPGPTYGPHEMAAETNEMAAETKESPFAWAPGEAERVSLFPIRHPDIWEFRKKLEALHWIAQEVDLTSDAKDWARMTEDQRHFVRMQLAFFSTIDVDVLRNIGTNFADEVGCLEARMVYAAQEDQECVHAEAYGLQVMAVMNGEEREATLNAARTMPVVARMRAWVLRWFDRALPLGERLVAFAAVEGVLFSASFSALQWLRELNLLPGITLFNTYILRDEGIHTLYACHLIRRRLKGAPDRARTWAIFESVVEVLDDFVTESLPVGLIGMNATLMRQYVRCRADRVLADMGCAPRWEAPNPFDFMEKEALNATCKANFFECSNGSYQEPGAGASVLALDDTPVDE